MASLFRRGACLSLGVLLLVCAPLRGFVFVHPGALDSREELEAVRRRIAANAEPWRSQFDQLRRSPLATRAPHGQVTINSRGTDAELSRDDAHAAYTQALLWYYSGDEQYARRAVAILDSWSVLEAFIGGSDQDRLQAGWLGAVFAPAAEILRLYPGWSSEQRKHLQAMFRRAFYPQLTTASEWNGNVDLTQIDALSAIAVFNEDEPALRLALSRLDTRLRSYIYLRSDGPGPVPIAGDHGASAAFWFHPGRWVDGLTQETCRDNGHHTQFALGSALHVAELAWHQGIDVYARHEARLTAASELLAGALLSGSMEGLSKGPPTADRYHAWELAYNHYQVRRARPLPLTQRLLCEQIRPLPPRADWNLLYETLTHAADESPNRARSLGTSGR